MQLAIIRCRFTAKCPLKASFKKNSNIPFLLQERREFLPGKYKLVPICLFTFTFTLQFNAYEFSASIGTVPSLEVKRIYLKVSLQNTLVVLIEEACW